MPAILDRKKVRGRSKALDALLKRVPVQEVKHSWDDWDDWCDGSEHADSDAD